MTRLRIEYDGQTVGYAYSNDDQRFCLSYASDWLDAADTFPVSVRLPLRAEPYLEDEAHVFFANLLPEGAYREALCQRLGISYGNDVALLKTLGGDTAGALRFIDVDADSTPRPRREITDEELERWATGAAPVPVDDDLPTRLSLAGAQNKTTVIATDSGFATPGSDEASTHILKFDSPRFAHLSANEFITTKFLAGIGLDVVEVDIKVANSAEFLIIRRYDRVTESKQARRLHQEDFCQILGYAPATKYESEGGPKLRDVADAIRQYSSAPALDILRLVRWSLACAISGNADGHAKNLSLVTTDSGRRLSPHYDLVSTRAYEQLDKRMAFAIGGVRDADQIRRAALEEFAATLAVKESLVVRELQRLLDAAPSALDAACETHPNSPMTDTVRRVIQKRLRAMAAAS